MAGFQFYYIPVDSDDWLTVYSVHLIIVLITRWTWRHQMSYSYSDECSRPSLCVTGFGWCEYADLCHAVLGNSMHWNNTEQDLTFLNLKRAKTNQELYRVMGSFGLGAILFKRKIFTIQNECDHQQTQTFLTKIAQNNIPYKMTSTMADKFNSNTRF